MDTTNPVLAMKAHAARIKAADLATGEFEAIVSVFNTIDSYGDVVVPGAFADSLEEWKSGGTPIPVIWSHQWTDLDSHVGVVTEAEEWMPGDPRLPADLAQKGGLWIRAQLDSEGKAAKLRSLLKGGRVKQFSFAYNVRSGDFGQFESREVYFLRSVGILEVGPCLIGANSDTTLLDIKSRQRGSMGTEAGPPAHPDSAESAPSHPAGPSRVTQAALDLLNI